MPLEHQQILASFDQAAGRYEQHAVLQKEALNRLLERVAFDMTEAPVSILDLGCGTGWACERLLQLYPRTHIIAADFAPKMIAQIPAHPQIETRLTDAHCIDVNTSSVDLIHSNLMLQWCNEKTVFKEIKRALRPGGTLHLTTMGVHTLHELKSAWQSIDDKPHINHFAPANDLADQLFQMGFEDVIADSEFITLTYASLIDLMKDIKNIGAHNTDSRRSKGLTTPATFKKLDSSYQSFVKDGVYPATYEVVYLRAKKSNLDTRMDLKIKSADE